MILSQDGLTSMFCFLPLNLRRGNLPLEHDHQVGGLNDLMECRKGTGQAQTLDKATRGIFFKKKRRKTIIESQETSF